MSYRLRDAERRARAERAAMWVDMTRFLLGVVLVAVCALGVGYSLGIA